MWRGFTDYAELAYGMVHPDRHRSGFGTTLLLARLASLPEPGFCWLAQIGTVSGSQSFYGRFGFRFRGRFRDERGTEFDFYRMRVYRSDWRRCRELLYNGNVDLDFSDAVVPTISDVEIEAARRHAAKDFQRARD